MERYHDTNTPVLVYVGVISTVVFFALIVCLQVLYYTIVEQDFQKKVVEAPTIESDSRIAEQQIQLTQYGWLDRDEKKVAIPIDRAMELVINELRAVADQE